MPRLHRSNYLSVTACMHPFPSEPTCEIWLKCELALIITTRQNLLRQTSIFATGPFKRNIVLLYTVPSVIYIIFGTCTYFKRNLYCPIPLEPVRNTRDLNIGLIHPSVHQCTAQGDQLLIQHRARSRCLTFDTVSNYHSLLRYSA